MRAWKSQRVLAGGRTCRRAGRRARGGARRDRISAVATFSILGDLVKNVGGDRVEVATLVGPDGDAHVYSPTPGDARKLAAAKIVFVNGLGLEGWMTRLIKASGTRSPIVTVTNGLTPRKMEDEERARPPGDRSACLAVGRQRQDLRRQHPRRARRGRPGRKGDLRGQCGGLSRQARCSWRRRCSAAIAKHPGRPPQGSSPPTMRSAISATPTA